MTRSGDEYVRGLRDGRTVLLNGERVPDVTTHPAFAAGIRTVAQLYDLAHDPANREVMTYASPRDGRSINKCWLVPRTRPIVSTSSTAVRRRRLTPLSCPLQLPAQRVAITTRLANPLQVV
jgi:4-hydroxyphenylacetate 3-monooxygenase